jgi:uncharacterized Fe-S cluster-containing radical SAM superfamily protein
MAIIDSEGLAQQLRVRSIRPESREILMSRLEGSDQEQDLTEPPNCNGFGRLRHFKMSTPPPWPANQLPILPAAHSLGVPPEQVSLAQVFQNASCNWRCWYCYVPFNLLAANPEHSGWLTPADMVGLYANEPARPLVIDCSGGQPDLVPEWIPWMMEALRARGLTEDVYLWSDDNLSNDYFWRYLTSEQRATLSGYQHYGRVGCFKGFNSSSFSFNTKADPTLFDGQFDLFRRLLTLGIDLYAYATFTAPDDSRLVADMASFVDRLQEIHPNLPLRLVPLRIKSFGVVESRVGQSKNVAIEIQEDAVRAWNDQLSSRFSIDERAVPMPLVSVMGT